MSDMQCGQWVLQVDFLWHRNTPSPNWSVIATSERAESIAHEGWSISSGRSSSGDSKGGEKTAYVVRNAVAASDISTTATTSIPLTDDEDEL